MPIYEYRCPKCQKIFEEWSNITEDHPEEPCPDCGTASPRIMSSTSFVLEGGGWYVTDYGYRKGVKEEKKDSSSEAPAAKTSDNASTAGSTETKGNASSNASSGTGEAKSCAKSDAKPAASATKAE